MSGRAAASTLVERLHGPTWEDELGADHPFASRARKLQGAAVRGQSDHSCMVPLRDPMSKASRLALQRRTAREREVQGLVCAAGATAKARMHEQSWQSGTRRESLFDDKHFLKAHEQKEASMQSCFKQLYVPIGSAYWSPEAQGLRAREARKAGRNSIAAYSIESWRASIPAALSLDHLSVRDGIHEREHAGPELTEQALGIGYKCRFAAPEAFDPMAAPLAFYSSFKEKLAVLRADVAQPPSENRLEQTPTAALFPPPAAPAASPAPPEPDEDLVQEGEDASAIYLTSLNYLASCGIEIPEWDEAKTGLPER